MIFLVFWNNKFGKFSKKYFFHSNRLTVNGRLNRRNQPHQFNNPKPYQIFIRFILYVRGKRLIIRSKTYLYKTVKCIWCRGDYAYIFYSDLEKILKIFTIIYDFKHSHAYKCNISSLPSHNKFFIVNNEYVSTIIIVFMPGIFKLNFLRDYWNESVM